MPQQTRRMKWKKLEVDEDEMYTLMSSWLYSSLRMVVWAMGFVRIWLPAWVQRKCARMIVYICLSILRRHTYQTEKESISYQHFSIKTIVSFCSTFIFHIFFQSQFCLDFKIVIFIWIQQKQKKVWMKNNSCDIPICHSDCSINVPPNNAENGAEAWTIARLLCWWWNAHCTKPFLEMCITIFCVFFLFNSKEMNIFSRNQFTHRPLERHTHCTSCFVHWRWIQFFSDEMNTQF